MIDFNILIALISYYFVMYVTPGTNNAMVLASVLKFGFNKSIPHISGITIGHVTQLILVCFGLGKIFQVFPNLQNILKITDNSNSDSTILGVITSATDGPFTFDSNEQVDEYRFSISLKILWVDNENEKNLIEKTFTGFGNYSINNDPSSDGIDNDNDGILDENDDDEFGDSRELAINIAINKIASDVVNSILSTW